jgi:hypothetical protein
MTTGTWLNPDGLQVRFGQYWADSTNNILVRDLGVDSAYGEYKVLVYDLDLTKYANGVTSFTTDTDNDGVRDGFNDGDVYLPKNSSVLRVTAYTLVAATGGTSFTLGTYTKAGASIAATGLVTATEGVIANFDTVGKRTYGAGALTASTAGTAGVGTAAAYVAAAITGTFTAGKIRFYIEHVAPLGDAVS